ncbi:class I SAM-dependent methyltransferase [uncultured Faecalibaculum sp.]|uniref:class I SAM-dependent methyltransferase n=1 Tax=uncultured Faecalibaculum sp. TaxID=1729681 RepID=UPI0025F8854C|nr:methyltransferase [uncultured Faecalibaculum sp.]
MSHYYTNEETPDVPSSFSFELAGRRFPMKSNAGVFSKDKLDEGTRVLLETVLQEADGQGPVLDMGCGIGPVAKVIASLWQVPVTAVDVNEKAAGLARENTGGLPVTVLVADGVQGQGYANILINPPIRTGKETVYRLLAECVQALKEQGVLWIVMRKDHGVKSAMKHLEDLGCQVQRVNRDKGFWVLKVSRESQTD